MKKVQNLVAVSKDTYIDKEGKERRNYVVIGTVFTNKEGRQSVQQDFNPAHSSNWFISIMDRKL